MFLFNSLSLSTPASSLRKIATADPFDENEASDKEGGEVEVARMWLVLKLLCYALKCPRGNVSG